MKRLCKILISLILILAFSVNVFAADTKDAASAVDDPYTSTDTGNFALHTGYYDMHFHYTRYLNLEVGEKSKVLIYVPENLFEGAKVVSITNNFPYYLDYSGDGTIEALKSVGYGHHLMVHTVVYIPKEDRYMTFTTKVHTYNGNKKSVEASNGNDSNNDKINRGGR